ncbi:type II toxin-antitoxin system mRNA interferase toxin, RelE/StbE family [Levilactobacillus cerevisiae]|uniref:type II toxin-antitoxin system mRNA interferase toxin, RelE/StbE family n=1 Tax=Levilactobacillus cerevisiae TaxID=1704076 RepID=UPI000F78C404
MEDQLTLQKDYHLHTLKGDKAGIYELHLERNWLLLYQITGTTELTLLLLRTGTHDII